MNRNQVVELILTLLLYLLISGCGESSVATPTPTSTGTPTTAPTLTSTSVPTDTPGSAGMITGRVYWETSGDPVQIELILVRGSTDDEDRMDVATTQSDQEGNYAFTVQESGTYHIKINTVALSASCSPTVNNPRPRSLNNWPFTFIETNDQGNVIFGIVSQDISIQVAEIFTLDCALYCQ